MMASPFIPVSRVADEFAAAYAAHAVDRLAVVIESRGAVEMRRMHEAPIAEDVTRTIGALAAAK